MSKKSKIDYKNDFGQKKSKLVRTDFGRKFIHHRYPYFLAELYDMEPASRYRIYVVSVQEKESFTDEAGEVFTSYTGDPIHGLTQINAPAEVRVIKHGMKNGTVTVMWEGVEKASTYRVGIVPSEGIIGTGTYSNEETETKLYGLDPTKAYKVRQKNLFYVFN